MKSRHLMLISIIFLVCIGLLPASCQAWDNFDPTPIGVGVQSSYQYQLGLGYGFLGKEIQVSVDGNEVLSLVGTEEIETFAQMQGTYMLISRSSMDPDIIVRVTVDKGQPYQQKIDLDTGRYVHIYLNKSGVQIYNTYNLILE